MIDKIEKRNLKRPIPPKTVVRLASHPRWPGSWRQMLGQVFRIGYYGQNDGLDCIWLVNDEGKYQETIDHDYLFKYFDIIELSDEKDVFGKRRPRLGPITRASVKLSKRARKG
jgi:hypothetical protein